MKNKFSQIRERLINLLEDQTINLAKRIQLQFEQEIIDHFEDLIVDDKGLIKNTLSNYTKIRQVDKLKVTFYTSTIKPFLGRIATGFVRLLIANTSYYKEFEKNFNDKTLQQRVSSKLLKQQGIVQEGNKYKLLKGGMIDTTGDLSFHWNEIKKMAIRAARSGVSLAEFKKQIKDFVRQKSQKFGLLESHFYTNIYDAYAQFDAMVAEEYRKEFGYRAAFYQGGLIKTSRGFCIDRNNKVYTEDEIEEWKEIDFDGKPPNYNPFIDRGGYNCRHFFDWIPDELAVQLRPELKNYFKQLV